MSAAIATVEVNTAQPETRAKLIAITTNAVRGIHFCNHPLLSGSNFNLWFPVSPDESWFVAIERILTMNGVAENVTSVTPIREAVEYTDFEIIFNRNVV